MMSSEMILFIAMRRRSVPASGAKVSVVFRLTGNDSISFSELVSSLKLGKDRAVCFFSKNGLNLFTSASMSL